jgi:hypothetical protein
MRRLLLLVVAYAFVGANGYSSDCISYILSCASCGLAVCDGQKDGTKSSSPLDICLSPAPLSCSLHKDGSGNRVICGDANQVTRCYQRDIKTSGYKCSDGILETETATGCCKG